MDDVEKEMDEYVGHMEAYVNALKLEIKARHNLISLLQQAEVHLDTDKKDVKLVANVRKLQLFMFVNQQLCYEFPAISFIESIQLTSNLFISNLLSTNALQTCQIFCSVSPFITELFVAFLIAIPR